MEDKMMMDQLLTATKGMCDLLMHGTIESSTPKVHVQMKAALNDCLCMQNDIYTKMSEKGWYPTQQAEPQKIQDAKQKFSNSL